MISPVNITTGYPTYVDDDQYLVTLESLPYFDEEQYDLANPKDYAKYIQETERIIRCSFEYRHLVMHIKYVDGMNECSYLRNVYGGDRNSKIQIELHHAPLTLFDVVAAVAKKRAKRSELVDVFNIAKEVLWLHYAGWIGLVPVCTTVHEMIHNHFLMVPTNIVRGAYGNFIEAYKDYIEGKTLDAVLEAEKVTMEYLQQPNPANIIVQQMAYFNIHPTYVRIENLVPNPALIQKTQDLIRSRINIIKSGKRRLYKIINPDALAA